MECQNVSNGKVYPTFHIVSKGLGESYVHKMRDFHLKGLEKYFNGRYYDFTDASMEVIMSKFRIKVGDFEYALPRYYINKIYGEKTLLSAKISEFLLAKNDAICDSQLRQLQAQNPSDSPYRLLDLHNQRENSLKAEQIRKQNARFYNKSKI